MYKVELYVRVRRACMVEGTSTREAVSPGLGSLVLLTVILHLFTFWGIKPWEVG